MKKFFLPLLALATITASSVRAENIDWAAVFGNVFRLENNAPNPTGNAILLGRFGASNGGVSTFTFSSNDTYAFLLSNFTQYDATTMGTGVGNTGPGTFSDSTGNVSLPGSAGDQLYMWVFNSPTPATATQWAIVTSTLWTRPASGANSSAFDIADGVSIPAGALGSLIADGMGGFDVGLRTATVIPEPSTYAMGILGAASLIALRRRRK